MRQTDDQDKLAHIATTARDMRVRIAAVKKLEDQQLLERIVWNDEQVRKVREAAAREIENQDMLARIALQHELDRCRLVAVAKLTDLELLLQMASDDENMDVRGEAEKRMRTLRRVAAQTDVPNEHAPAVGSVSASTKANMRQARELGLAAGPLALIYVVKADTPAGVLGPEMQRRLRKLTKAATDVQAELGEGAAPAGHIRSPMNARAIDASGGGPLSRLLIGDVDTTLAERQRILELARRSPWITGSLLASDPAAACIHVPAGQPGDLPALIGRLRRRVRSTAGSGACYVVAAGPIASVGNAEARRSMAKYLGWVDIGYLILVEADRTESQWVLDADMLERMLRLRTAIQSSGSVAKVEDFTDAIRAVHRDRRGGKGDAFKLPETRPDVRQCGERFVSLMPEGLASRSVSDSFDAACVTLYLKSTTAASMDRLVQAGDQFMRQHGPRGVSHLWILPPSWDMQSPEPEVGRGSARAGRGRHRLAHGTHRSPAGSR